MIVQDYRLSINELLDEIND